MIRDLKTKKNILRDGIKAFIKSKNKEYFSVIILIFFFKSPASSPPKICKIMKAKMKIINKGVWHKIYHVNAIQEYSTKSRLTINIPRTVICIFQY